MKRFILGAALAASCLSLGACANFQQKLADFSAAVKTDAALVNEDIAAVSQNLPQFCAIVNVAIADYNATLTGKGSSIVASTAAGAQAGCDGSAPVDAVSLAAKLIKVYRAVKST